MEKTSLFCRTLTAAACCVALPVCALETTHLASVVNRQIVAQTVQTEKAKTAWEELLQAHNGNAEAAVEDFAEARFPEQYSNTAVYVEAIYANPQDQDKLLVKLVNAVAWLDLDKKVRFYYTFSLVPTVRGAGYETALHHTGSDIQGTFVMPWNTPRHGYYEYYVENETTGKVQLYQVEEKHAQETMDALAARVIDWNEHWFDHAPKGLTLKKQETNPEHQTEESCCEERDKINAALQAEEQLWQGGKNLSQQEVKELLKQFAGRDPFVTSGQNENNCELRYVYGDKKHHEIYAVSICASEKPEGWNVSTLAFSLYPERKVTTMDQHFFFNQAMAKIAAFDEKEELRALYRYTFVWSH